MTRMGDEEKVEIDFQTLIEHVQEGIAIISAEGKPVYMSPSVETKLGYTVDEAMAMDLFSHVHPDDVLPVAALMEQVLANPGVPIKGHTGRMRHKDGTWRWVDAVVTNMLHDPAIRGIIDVFRDVTDSHVAEEKLIHANRLYSFISQINQTIVRSTNEQELFSEACRIAIEFGKFAVAWIGIIDTEIKNINIVAQAGMMLADLPKFTNVTYGKNGPQDIALSSGEYYICNNIETNLELENWKPYAAERGFKSCMVLPIKEGGKIRGTFNLYATEADFFSIREIELLKEATGDISFALDVFEKERLRLLTADKLKYSETSLKQAQSIAKTGSWETDLQTMMVTWSDEIFRIFERPKDGSNLRYVDFIQCVHPDDREMLNAALNDSIKKDIIKRIEHRIITGKGKEKFVVEHWDVFFDSSGVAVKAMGTCQDITEQKKLEIQLGKSEAFNSGVLSSLNSQIAVVDENGVIIAVNKAWEDFSIENGCTVLERTSKGSNYFDVCRKALAAGEVMAGQAMAGIKSILNKEQRFFEMEYPCHSPTEQRWFALRVVNFGDDETKVVCSHIDITEREKALKELRKSQSNLQAVLENTDAVIYSLDRNYRYITFNQQLKSSLKEAYGLDIQQGDPVYDFLAQLDPEEAKGWKDVYNKALNGEFVKFEKEFRIGDFYSCISFSIYPIVANEKIIGISCFGLDITKKKEEELHKEKLTEQLIQRNKDLEQFSYIVSHNLRSPVANITGLTELLQLAENDEEEKAMMTEQLALSVKKLDNVIKDLNYVLQVKDPVSEHKEMIKFSELIMDISQSIRHLYKNEDIEIITDFSAAEGMLSLKSYLYSIFFNLVSNSIKYKRPGINPVIEVSSRIENDKLVLRFKDNGLGIDLAQKGEQVFGLYKRFHNHIEGKGIGLYLVKTQVETLGAKITVESEVDRGTTFTIIFDDFNKTQQ